MRRDYFTLDARGLEWVDSDGEPEKPTVVIDFEGPASLLEERIADGEELLTAAEVDVSFRFQTDSDAADATGVVSVTNRITGDFVLELNRSAEDVLRFVRVAREYGKRSGDDGGRYRITIRIDGETVVTYEKRTFLVYDRDGNLLRQSSLIPSGVEL